jgi:uncharacterized protein (DUF427 family)
MSTPPSNDALLRVVPSARAAWQHARRPSVIDTPGPGQESVWSFPRPPRVEPVTAPVTVALDTRTIASTRRAERVCETAGAPCYYLPPEDVDRSVLVANGRWSVCEWKGVAYAYDIVTDTATLRGAAWSYHDPLDDLGCGFARIAGWFAFYASSLVCAIDGERVTPQPGGFYGGWVTSRLTGPIKGVPGSEGW